MVDSQVVADFFGVLLLGGAAGVIVAVARPSLRHAVIEAVLPITALVATGAMLGSLYFSEVANFVPCELCWFQRIAMYPLAIILVTAAVRSDRAILPYVLTLSGIGLAISLYHIQLQILPDQGSFCDAVSPCSAKWVEGLGFLTIPQMAGISFAIIAGVSALSIMTNKELA